MGRANKHNIEARINLVLGLMALWMGAWLISLWAWILREEPSQGISNLQTALGWQGIAGMIAFAIWAVGFGLPSENGVKRLSAVPLGMSAFVCGLVIFGVV